MNVLLTGANGFIGSRLDAVLRARGHTVIAVVHRPQADGALGRSIALDFARATDVSAWREAVAGCDVVVNTVGIFREEKGQRFATLHSAAPRALFDACAEAGVRRVIQLSALGAGNGRTPFHTSKAEADRHLLSLGIDGVVARPSLVFGPDGASARAFLRIAAAPLLFVPAGGRQRIQPVHVDDVVAALCALAEAPKGPAGGRVVALTGPRALTLREYLETLRAAMRLPRSAVVAVPRALVALGSAFGELRGSLLTRASWQMLEQGNVADAGDITRLLGHPPREPARFLDNEPVGAVRAQARLGWVLPLLRWSLALVWIVTAIVSLWLFPVAESLALLARTGVAPSLAPLMLAGAASLDLAFGVLTAFPPRSRRGRRALWIGQALLMGLYMIVIAWKLPEFWLHPFGPLLKNLPILAILVALTALDDE